MSNISKVLWFIFLLMLTQCKSNQKELKDELVEKDMEKQMIEVYKEGLKSLEEGDNLFAAKKFSEAEILYPQSKWASQAILMSAYSYYELNFLSSAIDSLIESAWTIKSTIRLISFLTSSFSLSFSTTLRIIWATLLSSQKAPSELNL